MRRLLRALVRAVLESEAATLAHDVVLWRERAIAAETQLGVIAALLPDSRIERTPQGFAAHVVSSSGTRHKGVGLTASEAIRASGA